MKNSRTAPEPMCWSSEFTDVAVASKTEQSMLASLEKIRVSVVVGGQLVSVVSKVWL